MYSIEGGEIRLQPNLSEATLRECAVKVAGASLDPPSIILNSVMVPVGRRNRKHQGGYMDIVFAHTSFQEFFLARHIFKALLENKLDQSVLHSVVPKPVMRFLNGMISNLSLNEQAEIRIRLNPK
jgi:hypothetical protein